MISKFCKFSDFSLEFQMFSCIIRIFFFLTDVMDILWTRKQNGDQKRQFYKLQFYLLNSDRTNQIFAQPSVCFSTDISSSYSSFWKKKTMARQGFELRINIICVYALHENWTIDCFETNIMTNGRFMTTSGLCCQLYEHFSLNRGSVFCVLSFFLRFVSKLLYQLRLRPVKHLKMTVTQNSWQKNGQKWL